MIYTFIIILQQAILPDPAQDGSMNVIDNN